jgi:ankyrin repeat protein
MKKGFRYLHHFLWNVTLFAALLVTSGALGMREEEEKEPSISIKEEVVSEISITEKIDSNKVFLSWLGNAVRKLARDEIVALLPIPFPQANNKEQIVGTRIKKMNFPETFKLPMINVNDLVEIYKKTYKILNLSLYPLANFKKTGFFDVKIKTQTRQGEAIEVLKTMKYKQIIGIEQAVKNALVYYEELSSNLLDILKNITVPSDFQRVFLTKVTFNKIIKTDNQISINGAMIVRNNIAKEMKTLSLLQDNNEKTLLHFICERINRSSKNLVGFTEDDKTDLIKNLLNNGADPNVPDRNGNTPLLIVCTRKTMNQEVIKLLVTEKQSQPNKRLASSNIQNNDGMTPLHLLCDTISKILDKDQRTNLIDNTISPLFENHADPNLQEKTSGKTSLHIALENGYNMDIFTLLIQKNANPNIKDNEGNTAFHYICLNEKLGDTEKTNMMEIIFAHYDDQIININSKNATGHTPLLLACSYNNTNLAIFLLKHGADPLMKYDNTTVLHHACNNGNFAIVRAILKTIYKNKQISPEQIKAFINVQDNVENTAAHYAAGFFDILIQRIIDEFIPLKTKRTQNLLNNLKKITEEPSNKQVLFINALRNAINEWQLPEDKGELEKSITQLKKQLQEANNIMTAFTATHLVDQIPGKNNQTPKKLHEIYALVAETALAFIEEKVTGNTELRKIIVPEHEKLIIEPVAQPKKEEPVVKTFLQWSKEKIIGSLQRNKRKIITGAGIAIGVGAVAISLPYFYKLLQKYRKK